jgi:hypothetical protein
VKTSSKRQSSTRIFENSLLDRDSKGARSTRISLRNRVSNSIVKLNHGPISKGNGSTGPFKSGNQSKNITQKPLFPGPKGPWRQGFGNGVRNSSVDQGSLIAADNVYLRDLPAEIIQAYGSWIKGYLDQEYRGHGWDGYLMTFMFQQISGSVETKVQEMHREIETVYGKLLIRFVARKPKSKTKLGLLPRGVFFPDIPGLKPSKQELRDVRVNEGLHFHGVVVVNRGSRLKERLDIHFQEKMREYLSDNLRRIHVEPITHEPGYTTDYGGKSIKRKRFPTDHILVLPRSVSELPDNNANVFSDPRERAIKAIQSSTNVSDQVAQEMYDVIRAGAKKG